MLLVGQHATGPSARRLAGRVAASVTRICPACGAESPGGARFCPACGARFSPVCPDCGRPASVGDRFCAACGRELELDAWKSSSGAVPVGAHRLEGERKQVTVLFADVAGSMDLAERVDAEDWAALMDRFFRVLSEGVVRFGGTVDKFTGDGIMAIFGAPRSYEDHARRACAAALALRAATTELGLAVRLGLNSGEAVVGGIGDEGQLEYTALGHTVGLAQRMESLAEPGTAFLTESTARLVRSHFSLRDLGFVAVKGSSEPMRAWALEAELRRGGTGGGSVALIGRAEEMGALEAALARAQEGQAQVVGVVGEAGVGKSRLCEELARSATARGITVRRAAGVSHAMDVPLLPMLEFFRDYFGVLDTDSRSDGRQKISARLLDLDPSFEDDLPLLFDFLAVPDPERPPPRLSPEVRMERVFAVLRRITQRRSERETLVLLLEDLHWFDPASRAFVETLIPSFPGTRTLVLSTFRPEFTPPWAAHSYYRQLPLGPLDANAVDRLLVALVGRDNSLAPVQELIAEATGGSPLFIEEVVRALVEDGSLLGEPGAYQLARPVEALAVPPTVQATLAARIDRLAAADKAVLQTAAVIGRQFTEPVLRLASSARAEDVRVALGRLCAGEFLQVVPDAPVEEYRFWHPLTQEVAYRSLLRERRAALHHAVAQAIIATDPERLDERAALLATHFDQAGDPLEAARWNNRAADFAVRSDIGESMRRWRTTIERLACVPETDEALRLGVRARERLIRFMGRTGVDLDEVGRLFADGKRMAEDLGDPARLAAMAFGYGSTLMMRGALPEMTEQFQLAANFGEESDDPEARATFCMFPAVASVWIGPVGAGLEVIALGRDRCGGDTAFAVGVLGYSPLSAAAIIEAQLLAVIGRVDEARAFLQSLTSGPRRHVDLDFVAWAWWVAARLAHTEAEFQAALAGASEAASSAEASGHTWVHVLALGGIGVAELGLGRCFDAAQTLERALVEAREHKTALFDEAQLIAYLARVRLCLGEADTARAAATEAVEVARRQGARIVECFALLTRARILHATGGDPDDVEDDLAAALILARETGAAAYEAEIRAEQSQCIG
jgi:class 3 adenylate cyclase/tetratricopeptide (TPR) repeat protein